MEDIFLDYESFHRYMSTVFFPTVEYIYGEKNKTNTKGLCTNIKILKLLEGHFNTHCYLT